MRSDVQGCAGLPEFLSKEGQHIGKRTLVPGGGPGEGPGLESPVWSFNNVEDMVQSYATHRGSHCPHLPIKHLKCSQSDPRCT